MLGTDLILWETTRSAWGKTEEVLFLATTLIRPFRRAGCVGRSLQLAQRISDDRAEAGSLTGYPPHGTARRMVSLPARRCFSGSRPVRLSLYGMRLKNEQIGETKVIDSSENYR